MLARVESSLFDKIYCESEQYHETIRKCERKKDSLQGKAPSLKTRC